jgi:hypothetical protein
MQPRMEPPTRFEEGRGNRRGFAPRDTKPPMRMRSRSPGARMGIRRRSFSPPLRSRPVRRRGADVQIIILGTKQRYAILFNDSCSVSLTINIVGMATIVQSRFVGLDIGLKLVTLKECACVK